MYGSFSESALRISEELLYDYTRCVRPDGTAYGTRGKCRKGTEAALEKKNESLFLQGKDVDIAAVEAKAEEWRKKAGLQATPGTVDWKHDRVHALFHEFVGGDEAIGKWIGGDPKSPTPAEEALVNMVHRAASLKAMGEDYKFTDRELARYFTRDLQVTWGRGQIPDNMLSRYFKDDEDGINRINYEIFIDKFREMQNKPGFDKLLEASHAMWTEAGEYMFKETGKDSTLKEFLKDPLVRDAYRDGGIEEVARVASMVGNLEKNQELRQLAEELSMRAFKKSNRA